MSPTIDVRIRRRKLVVHKMSDEDAWQFLRTGSRTATFASTREDGRPHAVPT